MLAIGLMEIMVCSVNNNMSYALAGQRPHIGPFLRCNWGPVK
jgi:hypothetical protein